MNILLRDALRPTLFGIGREKGSSLGSCKQRGGLRVSIGEDSGCVAS